MSDEPQFYGLQTHEWAWAVGGVFAFLAAFIGIWTIRLHLKYNTHPVCKYEVRVLLLVPIYAIEAWLGLYFKDYTLYWDVLRESYEALVIYSFYSFLVTYLGGETGLARILAEKGSAKRRIQLNGRSNAGPPPVPTQMTAEAEKHILQAGEHIFPMNMCCRPYDLGSGQFQSRMRNGILQYVPIKVFCAITTFALQATHHYGNGIFSSRVGYPYIAFITNCSQIWAVYCLVLFYQALYEQIKNIKPLPKFLSVKLVVFFTFWQSVAIAFFIELQFLNATRNYTDDQVAAGIQDFIICIEMFIAAIAHIWIFPPHEFDSPIHPVYLHSDNGTQLQRLKSVMNPKDVVQDVHDFMVKPVTKKIKDRGTAVHKAFKIKLAKRKKETITTSPQFASDQIIMDDDERKEIVTDEEDSAEVELELTTPTSPDDRTVPFPNQTTTITATITTSTTTTSSTNLTSTTHSSMSSIYVQQGGLFNEQS